MLHNISNDSITHSHSDVLDKRVTCVHSGIYGFWWEMHIATENLMTK